MGLAWNRSAASNTRAVPPEIRILTADDHPLVREGLKAVLSAEPGLVVVAEAADGQEAVAQYRAARPDVVIMDLEMPGMSGLDAIRAIIAADPAARIVVLTTFDGDTDIHHALAAGARGYLLKHMARTRLVDAVRAVADGRRAVAPEVAERLAEAVPRAELTARELQVLRLIARGLSNKEIGGELELTEGTVKVHVNHILQKLGVDDRTGAVTLAIRRGVIRLP